MHLLKNVNFLPKRFQRISTACNVFRLTGLQYKNRDANCLRFGLLFAELKYWILCGLLFAILFWITVINPKFTFANHYSAIGTGNIISVNTRFSKMLMLGQKVQQL